MKAIHLSYGFVGQLGWNRVTYCVEGTASITHNGVLEGPKSLNESIQQPLNISFKCHANLFAKTEEITGQRNTTRMEGDF